MKNTIIFLITLSFAFILSSFSGCGKDIVEPKSPDPCLGMYDERSEPYKELYKGTLFRGCMVSTELLFPDKYIYWHLCTNPNNPYEIAYLKGRENPSALFKYDFCTGEETLLVSGTVHSPDWSVKDWIVFGKHSDGQLWKIKPNGDSLTQMTHTGEQHLYPRWSPDGTKCLYNNKSIVDENGAVLQRLHEPVYNSAWKDDTTIVFGGLQRSNPFNVKEYNLLNDSITATHSVPIHGGVSSYLRATNEILIIKTIRQGLSNTLLYSLTTGQSRVIAESTESYSIAAPVLPLGNNRFVYERLLKDTLTNNTCKLNYRSHIAIMNLDGTDERHVLLPE